MDFTYKLDRKSFLPMITNMDWLEESEIRKFQVALIADATNVHVTTYPTSAAEAYQRANSYKLDHSRTTTASPLVLFLNFTVDFCDLYLHCFPYTISFLPGSGNVAVEV